MKRLMTLLLILAAGTALTAQNLTRKEQIILLYAEVDTFLSEDDPDSACPPLEKLIKLDKANRSTLYLALGGIAEQKNETAKAVKYYKKAISGNRKSHKAYYGMGALYYNQAIETLNNAENMQTDEPVRYAAEIKKGMALLKKAKPFLEKGFQLSDDADVFQSPLQTINRYLQAEKRSQ